MTSRKTAAATTGSKLVLLPRSGGGHPQPERSGGQSSAHDHDDTDLEHEHRLPLPGEGAHTDLTVPVSEARIPDQQGEQQAREHDQRAQQRHTVGFDGNNDVEAPRAVYEYLLAAIKDGHNTPEVYITCEKASAEDSSLGTHIVRVFAQKLGQESGNIIDQSNSWASREAFITYALSGFQQMLQLQDEQPVPLS